MKKIFFLKKILKKISECDMVSIVKNYKKQINNKGNLVNFQRREGNG